MAEALFEDFLTCPICLDPLKEPVTLGCHHSFCCSCLNNSWDHNLPGTCPVCRRRSSREKVEVNFALRELSLSFSEQKKVKELDVKETSTKEAKVINVKICSSHPNVPPLFCLDEARAVCPVCEFSLHSQHTVVSGNEAEKRLKKQAQTQILVLKDQKQGYEELEKTYEELQRHQEEQTVECLSQITHVFSHLQQILKEEEEKALGVLREEQRKQTQSLDLEMHKVRDKIAALTNSIQDLQKSIDTHSFLSAPTQTTTAPLPRPQPKAGLLLDQAKVLGNLAYRVWMKMKTIVTYSPVIFDPNTAECHMHLSQDLCGVRHGPPRALPVVPERFTNESILLGSEGFSSGQHQWDVEVGDLPTWDIGVVKKSIDRRGEIFTGSKFGIWCLWHGKGRYTDSSGQTVSVESAPKKIRVKLDYEKGELSFYDADLLHLLLTHTAVFTETLFPYVSVGPAPEAKTKEVRVSGKDSTCSVGLSTDRSRHRFKFQKIKQPTSRS
ncbi:zinc-binding protein A33-like [Eucyclogobius newberryi]|uniref:zinc-binding protein A33-like n=1 Tax=Eucyclogobius newberryi TaxID=166745 RepID=UPI003B5CB182